MRGDAGAHGSGAENGHFIDALHDEGLGMKVLKLKSLNHRGYRGHRGFRIDLRTAHGNRLEVNLSTALDHNSGWLSIYSSARRAICFSPRYARSEEHTSELQSHVNL